MLQGKADREMSPLLGRLGAPESDHRIRKFCDNYLKCVLLGGDDSPQWILELLQSAYLVLRILLLGF